MKNYDYDYDGDRVDDDDDEVDDDDDCDDNDGGVMRINWGLSGRHMLSPLMKMTIMI